MVPGKVIKSGPRIRIRQLREDDIPRWMTANGSTRAAAEAIYREELAKPDGPPKGIGKQFSVETSTGEWIGFTGFGAEPSADAGGYFFIDAPARGKGYGKEMVRCVLDVMFDDCQAARCIIDYHDWNVVTGRLYMKLGFEEVIRILIPEDKLNTDDHEQAGGKTVYAVVLVLDRDRYLEHRSRETQKSG